MGSRTNAAAPSPRAHWLRTTAVIAAVSVGGLGAAGFLGQEALPLPAGPAPTARATTTGPTAAPSTPDPAATTAAPATEDPAADTRQALALLAPALSEASHFDAT
ncbi:MAG: hypothetical protein Q4G64_04885, partial [bacterium]|nr:hypothetical protein [bacterium]